MTRLPVPVRQVLLPAADELLVERVARRLAQRHRTAQRRLSPRLVAAVLVLLGFTAWAWVGLTRRPVPPPPVLIIAPPQPLAPPPIESPSEPQPVAPPRPVIAPTPAAKKAPPGPDWRPLAESADFAPAWELLGAEGFARETDRALDVHDLFLLADVARFSGRPALAVAPLEQVLARFSDQPEASLAAFTLGKLQLDVLGDASKAALAFERAISLDAPGTLKAQAYGRLADARAKAGDASGAEAAAAEYRRLLQK